MMRAIRKKLKRPAPKLVVQKTTYFKEICSTQSWQYTYDHYECESCGTTHEFMGKYCPECGAKILGKR